MWMKFTACLLVGLPIAILIVVIVARAITEVLRSFKRRW